MCFLVKLNRKSYLIHENKLKEFVVVSVVERKATHLHQTNIKVWRYTRSINHIDRQSVPNGVQEG
jgi:hypothetical protein